METIHVKAKDSTVKNLKFICDQTGCSQDEVIEKAIDILEDIMAVKKQFQENDKMNDTFSLTTFAKLLLNDVE